MANVAKAVAQCLDQPFSLSLGRSIGVYCLTTVEVRAWIKVQPIIYTRTERLILENAIVKKTIWKELWNQDSENVVFSSIELYLGILFSFLGAIEYTFNKWSQSHNAASQETPVTSHSNTRTGNRCVQSRRFRYWMWGLSQTVYRFVDYATKNAEAIFYWNQCAFRQCR